MASSLTATSLTSTIHQRPVVVRGTAGTITGPSSVMAFRLEGRASGVEISNNILGNVNDT